MKPLDSAPFRSASRRGVLCSILAFAVLPAHGEVVTAWNAALAEYASGPNVTLAPHLEARVHAMTHLAIVEAISDAARGARGAGAAVSARAATIASAKAMVIALLPQTAARAEALAMEQLSGMAEGQDKIRGLALGGAAAARVLRDRAADGWVELAQSYPPNGPLPDRSEALARSLANGANPPRSLWRAAKPFHLKSAAQFEPAVPAFTAVDGSVRVDHGLLSSRLFNAIDRTVGPGVLQQTWDERPVLQWNRVARAIVEGRGLALHEEARVFALLNIALADATLNALHCRFTLGSWNCMFIETWADGRGQPMRSTTTTAPAVFDSFERGTAVLETRRVLVPPLADYPSLAATLAGAAEAALTGGLKTDRGGFSLEIPASRAGRLRRSFGSVGEAARECAFVATLDGRHTREAGIAGHQLGATVGREVVKRFDRAHR